MLKKKDINNFIRCKYIGIFIFFFSTILCISFFFFNRQKSVKYSFFIEFNDANGIVIGTPIRMRGVTIGFIKNIKLKTNCVLVQATINSHRTIIPSDAIVETTQTGLLNEAIVDFIPTKFFSFHETNEPLSASCRSSSIICNNMYLQGDRGLNYDDLIRSTTRISQRFDDPRLFSLFYSFLQNGRELTETFSVLTKAVFDTLNQSINTASSCLDN